MQSSTQEFVAAQALLTRLAREDSSGSEYLYNISSSNSAPAKRPSTNAFEMHSFQPRLVEYSSVTDLLHTGQYHFNEALVHEIKEAAVSTFAEDQLPRITFNIVHAKHDVTKCWAALFTGIHAFDSGALPDYDKAFRRLTEFENEELNWDGLGGQPAAPHTARSVSALLRLTRELHISRPSLTLSNSGAVSVIWKDESRFVNLKFKEDQQYSAIVLIDKKPSIALNCTLGEFPPQLEQILKENFKEDVTAHLHKLPKRLR